ncbi:hypothetical protein KP509_36G039700 [Ceratopteris richardii]|uniref:AB hydrolase-1 domain-containing protein n=1 Tax=Ceratopteris richardii TaxID=49495 RepID=A0A8T2QCH4_CERRI|nr:hypothetical protein KP509_36G039700 [Ceratopteris richardii]KAH7281296.1 hypothetical protein KP509_36G039700 [Ceratopteris richardii]KAH7281297.1 hypothetical protein KP509_36G039700 [Ceratopteris richardii]KAH7281298.1 hypothetical protein KP509_36G039700 [Ceratopteris richardii]
MEEEHVFRDTDDSDFPLMSYQPRILEHMHSPRENSEQWADHHSTGWGDLNHVDGTTDMTRRFTHVERDGDTSTESETLERMWTFTAHVCTRVWEKLEPLFMDYMPEDKNPFWVCGVLMIVFLLTITGLRAGTKEDPSKYVEKVESVKSDKLPPINAPYVTLPDGRRIAYREQGVSQELARHTLVVVHGFPSSRLAGIPGIKSRLLEEFGVRLITYDRPGFGESDPYARKSLRASAQDMVHITDSLGVVEKFWVIGFSTGGIHAWAAMKYIPDRLAGVGLFAPGGNFYAPNMTKRESAEIWGSLNAHRKWLFRVARWVPSFLPYLCRRMLLENAEKLRSTYLFTAGKDHVLMQQEVFMKALIRDIEESIRQGNTAIIAQELLIQVVPWGFHLSDLRLRKRLPNSGVLSHIRSIWKKEEKGWEGFSAPIHIWQGTEDQIVPSGINEFAVRMVPQAMLHRLEGEGHFSYFWFCDKCHRNIFLTLFNEPEGVKVSTANLPLSGGLETLYQSYEEAQKRK